MPDLILPDFPAALLRALQRRARFNRRSLDAEVVALLRDGIRRPDRVFTHRAALARIARRRFQPRIGDPRTVSLIKEDRQR